MLPFNRFVGCLLLGTALMACGKKKDPDKQYFDKASEYNKYITDQFDEVNRLWNTTLSFMDDSVNAYQYKDSLIALSQISYLRMEKLADFKGDTAYKGAAQRYFKYIETTAKGGLTQAIELGIRDSLSDHEVYMFDSIGVRIGADKDIYIQKLKIAQREFQLKCEK